VNGKRNGEVKGGNRMERVSGRGRMDGVERQEIEWERGREVSRAH
jgi:hypothetical protein